ncbi:MAG: hypothetical protein ABW318_24145 [Vicinamibacterales bacterium]
MSDWLDAPRLRSDGVTIPLIWVAIALSLLVHIAVLWAWLPRLYFPSPENPEPGKAGGSLVVQLVPPASPPPSRPAPPPAAKPQVQPPPMPQAQPSPPRRAPPPKTAARPLPTPPVIALNRPAPAVPSPPPTSPSIAAPPPVRAPADGDLASYIEAKRRAQAASPSPAPAPPASVPNAQPVEDDNERSNRIVAANLGTQRTPTYGSDPINGGGIFQIKRLGYSDAEFVFFGWNKDIRRNTTQLIEVQKGSNSDIRIAVVRRMIAIIREYEQEEFLWESKRLGRNLVLSARMKDNAGLEDFMMQEFFYNAR